MQQVGFIYRLYRDAQSTKHITTILRCVKSEKRADLKLSYPCGVKLHQCHAQEANSRSACDRRLPFMERKRHFAYRTHSASLKRQVSPALPSLPSLQLHFFTHFLPHPPTYVTSPAHVCVLEFDDHNNI